MDGMDAGTTPKLYPSDFVGGDNKLGRGPLDDATHQIPDSLPCGFRQEEFKSFHLENLFLACVT